MRSLKCLIGSHDWSSWGYESMTSCFQVRSCTRSGCKKKETQIVHVFGKWDYEATDSCQRVRICQRCGEKEVGEKAHTWGDWKYVVIEDARHDYSFKLRQLHQILSKRFSESEIKILCFKLGIEYDDLPGDTKTNKVTELLKHLELRHRFPEFIKSVMHERTDIRWEAMGLLKFIEFEHFDIDKLSWEFDLSETCDQVRVCDRCGSQERREQHVWNNDLEYESPTTCTTVKYCRRCGAKESVGVQHQWDEGKWDAFIFSCRLIRTCQRCSAKDAEYRPHLWTPWNYESPLSCTMVRTCQRCFTNDKKEEHQWGAWKTEFPGGFMLSVRTCQRCQKEESRGPFDS